MWVFGEVLFNFYAEYIMRNSGLEEAQGGIKIARRNIKNLRYADDTTLNGRKQRTKEPLDEGERREWNVGLKFNIHKTKIMASGPIISWQIDGETVETVTDFIFGGDPKSLQMMTAAMKWKDACSLEEKLLPT